MTDLNKVISVNGRHYHWPVKPVVVICIDGSEPDYIELAIAEGYMPFLQKKLPKGTTQIAQCVIPGFTNPNNISIVTGVPPKIHGICGNFFYDREANEEVMMNDPKFLWAETIFAAFGKKGAKVVMVTAKDKLRLLLGQGLNFAQGQAICFSAEKADQATTEANGIANVLDLVGLPLPAVYSAGLSEFVFAAGVALMKQEKPDLMYLSTSDYLQHKYAPGSREANQFYAMIDRYLAAYEAQGAVIAITADHGMSAKMDANGEPDIIYLQTLMDKWYGAYKTRVILPITDPYIAHHGALGGFATIYTDETVVAQDIVDKLACYEGIATVLPRKEGCERFELPESRMGDVLVIATKQKVFGTTQQRHDLSGLKGSLRSHGGISERQVPLMFNFPTHGLLANKRLRNFDILDIALNHIQLP